MVREHVSAHTAKFKHGRWVPKFSSILIRIRQLSIEAQTGLRVQLNATDAYIIMNIYTFALALATI